MRHSNPFDHSARTQAAPQMAMRGLAQAPMNFPQDPAFYMNTSPYAQPEKVVRALSARLRACRCPSSGRIFGSGSRSFAGLGRLGSTGYVTESPEWEALAKLPDADLVQTLGEAGRNDIAALAEITRELAELDPADFDSLAPDSNRLVIAIGKNVAQPSLSGLDAHAFFGALGKSFFSKVGDVISRVATVAAPIVGTIVGGPVGGAIATAGTAAIQSVIGPDVQPAAGPMVVGPPQAGAPIPSTAAAGSNWFDRLLNVAADAAPTFVRALLERNLPPGQQVNQAKGPAGTDPGKTNLVPVTPVAPANTPANGAGIGSGAVLLGLVALLALSSN